MSADSVDWSAVRDEFPAASKYVYLKAGSGGILPRVTTRTSAALYEDWSEEGDINFQKHETEMQALQQDISVLLNASHDNANASSNIALTTNTSEAMNIVSFLATKNGSEPTHVVALWNEFPSATLPWINKGSTLHLVSERDVEAHGMVDAVHRVLRGLQSERKCLVVSHVSFADGRRAPLHRFGELCADVGALFAVDASQSLGVFPIDVTTAQIDAVVCNGYKWLCAGYGVGFAYLSQRLLAHYEAAPAVGWHNVKNMDRIDQFELLDGAARFMDGAPSFPGILALRASLKYFQSIGWPAIQDRILCLSRRLTNRLLLAGYVIKSPLSDDERSGNVLVHINGDPLAVAMCLKEQGIIVKEKEQALRVSTHIFNNEMDIDKLISALMTITPPQVAVSLRELCVFSHCPDLFSSRCAPRVLRHDKNLLVLHAGIIWLAQAGNVTVKLELQHEGSIVWAEGLRLNTSWNTTEERARILSQNRILFEWTVFKRGTGEHHLEWQLHDGYSRPLGICVCLEVE